MRGLRLLDGFEIDAKALGDAGPHVLDDDVGLLGQPHQDLAALVGLQVQRDGALVAMQVLEIRALAPAQHLVGAAFAGRWLDPDHVGAPVGQRAHAGGTGARQGQIEHLEARQRQPRGLRFADRRCRRSRRAYAWGSSWIGMMCDGSISSQTFWPTANTFDGGDMMRSLRSLASDWNA